MPWRTPRGVSGLFSGLEFRFLPDILFLPILVIVKNSHAAQVSYCRCHGIRHRTAQIFLHSSLRSFGHSYAGTNRPLGFPMTCAAQG